MKIGVIGCCGRMGQTHVREILEHSDCTLAGGVERPGSPVIGKDLGEMVGLDTIGISATDNMDTLIAISDAVIDFTTPETTLAVAALAARHNTVHVSGTTGLSSEQKQQLATFAKKTPIIWSANMSIGVNLLSSLIEEAASILGEEFDIEIVEMHHRHKVDAPSGTALALGEAAAKGRNVTLAEVAQKVRDGVTGARPAGEIGFATLRGGDVVGDHTVMFAGEGERIELTHKASNRTIFAKGAVRACLWAKDKQPGFYSMRDVLRKN